MRVAGDPKMQVNRVTASWGYMSAVAMAARPEIEAALYQGEVPEPSGDRHQGMTPDVVDDH